MNIQEIISTQLLTISGLRFMPIKANKAPIHTGWQKDNTTVYNFSNAVAVGLVCGAMSGNIEVIDFDTKYDITGKLFSEYKRTVQDIKPGLLQKMVVQKTMSGGYHFIYRCKTIGGNQKLANRETTEDEKKRTYEETYSKKIKELTGEENEENRKIAHDLAFKAMSNDKVRVLIETRGDGGQIACYPTPNYQFIHGDFSLIQEITEEERNILFDVAYSFNSVVKEESRTERKTYTPPKKTKGLTPYEDYNDRADVVGLLISHGWTFIHERGDKVMLRRPGQTSADTSGNFDRSKNWFSVFSTSTEFEPMKAYQPYAVFAILECNGDYSLAAKKLYELGYGERDEAVKSPKIDVPSAIDTTDNDYSFLSTEDDEKDYLDSWLKGTFQKGLTTGMSGMDKHFLFKKGNLVMFNGLDNVGKSTIVWFKAMLSARLHGWKWIIFSSENRPAAVRRKLMEFYWDKQIKRMNERELEEAKRFVYSHFEIIKNGEEMYNYMDIVNMTKKLLKKKKYDGLMIDPYNSLKVDSSKSTKGAGYDYHYEAASYLKLFGSNNNLCIYLNLHCGTSGARKVDNQGYTVAPQKADTEMGVMFPNKADEFITIHRQTQHETEFIFTEIHVRKVKEVETGGLPTPMYKPVILRGNYGLTSFSCLTGKNEKEVGENPIKSLIEKNSPKQSSIFDKNIIELPTPSLVVPDGFDDLDTDTESPF